MGWDLAEWKGTRVGRGWCLPSESGPQALALRVRLQGAPCLVVAEAEVVVPEAVSLASASHGARGFASPTPCD